MTLLGATFLVLLTAQAEGREPPTDAGSPPAGLEAATEEPPASSEVPGRGSRLEASAARDPRPPMSWDIMGGGVPESGVLASAQLGFSRLGEIRLEVPVLDALLVGAWVGFDLGYWTPERADQDLGLVFGATARLSVLHDAEWSIGLSASPGGRARLGTVGGGELVVPLSARALYALDPRILVGASIDMPLRLAIPSRGNAFFAIPITVGVVGEAHLLPSLAITAALGLGPALDTRGVETAFRGTVGVGYRL